MNGRFAAAEEHYRDALVQAEHNENGFDLCFVRNCMGVHFCLKHDWSQAIDHLTRSIEISTRMQLRELNGYAKFYQAQALYACGEQVQAIALAQDSLNTFLDVGYGLAQEVQRWLANVGRESR